MSGYLLDQYVPPTLNFDGDTDGIVRHPGKLWATVAATAFISPIVIILCRKGLFTEDSDQGRSSTAELKPMVHKSSATSPTKGKYARVDKSFDDELEDFGDEDLSDPDVEGFA